MKTASARLDELLQHPALWRARNLERNAEVLPAAAALREALPQGGWPQGSLSELLYAEAGIGELSLLLPTLAELTSAGRWCACVGAPARLFADMLQLAGIAADHLLLLNPPEESLKAWAVEQLLRSRQCALVIVWLQRPNAPLTRRLQLAAAESNGAVIALTPASWKHQSSPAPLRLLLEACNKGLNLQQLKARGRLPGQELIADPERS